jgi:catechol 2,3-dioxygenase-like lactoylglutathione lyase family enzyme
MARLRHIAVAVKDPEKVAAFYERAFGLKRVGAVTGALATGVYLSDGEVNLALLKYRGERGSGLEDAENFVGTHHFGFQVDSLEQAQKAIESSGGTFFFDLGEEQEENFERKFKDPDGVIFDISQKGWVGTASKK